MARSAEDGKVSEQESLVDDEALARDGMRDAVATVDQPWTVVAGDSSVLGIREPVYEVCATNCLGEERRGEFANTFSVMDL